MRNTIKTLLPDVSTRYGAPMGRHSRGIAENCELGSIHLFRVNLDSGGYDRGGAYWGHGALIYCATDGGDYFATVRASSRERAALDLGLLPEQMRAPRRAAVLERLRHWCAMADQGRVNPAGFSRSQLREFIAEWSPEHCQTI